MVNRSNIESKIVTVVGNLMTVQAYIAETDVLPYCTFTVESDTAVNTKDGIAAWKTEFTIYVVFSSKSDADSKADAIAAAFASARGTGFTCSLVRRTAYFDDELNVWGVSLEYESLTV